MSKYIYNVYIGSSPKDRRLFASCAPSVPAPWSKGIVLVPAQALALHIRGVPQSRI